MFYRLTPELIRQNKDEITFLVPFNKQVWISVIISFILIVLLYSVYSNTLHDLFVQYESSIIYVFSIIGSQGTTASYNHFFRRINTITGYFLMLIIVSVFAAKLYIVILTPPKDPFSTLGQLLNSDISLARHTTYGAAIVLFVSCFLFDFTLVFNPIFSRQN